MTNTYDWLCATLVNEYKLEAEKLTLDAPLEALGIDSLGLAELLFNVEDEFKIVLPRESVQLHTVGDVVVFIDALIAAKKELQVSPVRLPAAGPADDAVTPALPLP